MTQQIIIPWRDSGCPVRLKHFTHLYEFYSRSFEVIVSNNIGDFNRSAARNSGVERSISEISVVIDADSYIDVVQINAAIEFAKNNDKLIKPFEYFGYLTEKSTEMFYHGVRNIKDLFFIDPPRKKFCGAAYVMKRSLWVNIGGFDEAFVGYGAEDNAFHIKCEKILGKDIVVPGFAYHLDHPANRIVSYENKRRFSLEYGNK